MVLAIVFNVRMAVIGRWMFFFRCFRMGPDFFPDLLITSTWLWGIEYNTASMMLQNADTMTAIPVARIN